MPELTADQAMQLARQHVHGNQPRQAEVLLQQVLAAQPNHAAAMELLGVALGQAGQVAEAIGWIQRALELQPAAASLHFNLGQLYRLQGQFEEAMKYFRRTIALQPQSADAYFQLALLLAQRGEADGAIEFLERCVLLKPDDGQAHYHLGLAMASKGLPDQAIESFKRVLSLKADFAGCWYHMGNAHAARGRMDDAIECYRKCILWESGRWEPYNNLGNALLNRGRTPEAIAAYRQAIQLAPQSAEGLWNLGTALRMANQLDEALECTRQAVALSPESAEAHKNLGLARQAKGDLDSAMDSYAQALRLNPALTDACILLGNACAACGELEGTIKAYQQGIRLRPDDPAAQSVRVFVEHYRVEANRQTLLQEARQWAQRHADVLCPDHPAYSNDRTPDRRLRIGYVSADLRMHPVGLNMLPLLDAHAKDSVAIYCYSKVSISDELTEQIRRRADGWRDILGLPDETVAQRIRDDKIDILVDLALHTNGGSLLVLARKPAPVQVTFAGYPGTTGLRAIDYRLTDPYLDPHGENDDCYVEESVRLADSFWCYEPWVYDLGVGDLPGRSCGAITFGCLNHFAKVNPKVLAFWAKVLQAMPNSRLLLLAPEGRHRGRTLDFLATQGCPAHRIDFATPRARREYLGLYRGIDIGLDTIPYNGHTTSLDSYWMGVPVVTLVGQTAVGRAGFSQLMNLGLPELIARTPEEYVQIAAALAADLPRLAELRRTLRERMRSSPLMDGPRFARSVEAAYRMMWQRWCAGNH